VAEIRCSYCHDLHDTNKAPGDSSTGRPYLRGSWKRNPYREDGAPLSGTSYTGMGTFGAVPRTGASATEMGGYQIDQNNPGATAGYTPANSAGICILCHGNDIDNMNMFGNASDAWVGTNGHSNAVVGGTGSNAVNIFRTSWRNNSVPPDYTADGTAGGQPSMAYLNAVPASGNRGYGLRSQNNGGFAYTPQLTAGFPYGYDSYTWGATVDDTTTQTQFHAFSCSKCHNPHASRLPRLMITNCLDTKHNTWQDDYSPTPASDTNSAGSALIAANQSVGYSNVTSAQNCHRLQDPAYGKTLPAGAGGWNNVTPWTDADDDPGTLDDGSQDNPGIQ
jgi:hypothetical protein